MTRPHRRRAAGRRLGLRSRVVIAFGVGSALVSAVLAVATFTVVRTQLVNQRQTSVLRETFSDARLVKLQLAGPTPNVTAALSSLVTANDTLAFVYRRGLWFSTSASVSGTQIPDAITAMVQSGHVAEQRVLLAGTMNVVVGVPLPSIGVSYFEEHSLVDLQSTLHLLSGVLFVTAVATTLGGALAGLWASGRLVRPLDEIAGVASQIAGGALERRLPPDPDLEPLVVSFNDMVTALQQRIEQDARFASDVSHELRSPLTTLRAAVELLSAYHEQMPEGAQVATDTLDSEVTRFSSLVEDLLEMARMDAGAVSLNLADVPLDELVRHTVRGRRSKTPVYVAPDAAGLRVRADKRRLQQVVDNLLDNADAYGGGATLVSVERHDGRATIAVEDAGPGVDPVERDRIFDRFYRGALSGNRGTGTGTGLGLALVAEHVRAHEGVVRAEERAGGGARFVVELPIGLE